MREFLNGFVQMIQSYGIAGLVAISFAESSFFPIPPDVLLIPMAFMNRKLALLYALITTVASVLGGVFGHFIGRKLGKPILVRFFSKKRIDSVEDYFDKYGGWAVTIAGFTPIPYKIFTIAAGAFGVTMPVFVVSSIVGRAGRFFLEGLIIFLFGDTAKYYLTNYFESITVGITLFFIIFYILYRRLKPLIKFNGTGLMTFSKKKVSQITSFFKRYRKLDNAFFYIITCIAISLFSLFLFLDLAGDYFHAGSFKFDARIFDYIIAARTPVLTFLFKMITLLGNFTTMFIVVSIISWFLYKKYRKLNAIFFPTSIVGVWLFNELLKSIFKRPRPSGISLIYAGGYSFPSGHAMIFMAFALLIIYFIFAYFKNKKTALIVSLFIFILSVFVGISRVYLGVHYFSDIISGWLAAILWTIACIAVHRTLIYKK